LFSGQNQERSLTEALKNHFECQHVKITPETAIKKTKGHSPTAVDCYSEAKFMFAGVIQV
jgi:hypothetical protein